MPTTESAHAYREMVIKQLQNVYNRHSQVDGELPYEVVDEVLTPLQAEDYAKAIIEDVLDNNQPFSASKYTATADLLLELDLFDQVQHQRAIDYIVENL